MNRVIKESNSVKIPKNFQWLFQFDFLMSHLSAIDNSYQSNLFLRKDSALSRWELEWL